ncbi:hypothetical protein CHLNCDRAFT_135780 [Chlorella variabilis]|uniref:Uncharacterized protein n=1 Tax=Chlorella variabilis TaxID=554065 RepID=E1ZIZ7_CHLVA|nr:hypothetical protein CHLNCDRAFT_135780 [Chlorella variabilis]EFN54247.1 hypothetical protein CHLNCDRAFT_135780 [Chlorella variabilis]|eukprot:XP_005846349.1 hypothetical protein CHLNCDRAFT_135780 [Chlorella variabilis]
MTAPPCVLALPAAQVQSMVQYWEAVASGTPAAAAAAGVTGEEAAEAEAYACAAVAAAEAALGARQAEAEAAAAAAEAEAAADEAAGEAVAEEAAGQVAQLTTASSAAQASPAAPAASPAATPGTLSRHLPAGEAATPCGPAALAGAATPARPTPLNFVSAPPPTPASGSGGDPQHAQQLHQLAVGMAAAAAAAAAGQATPPSAQRSGSRLPGTPAATPASCTVAAAVTPLALSALRARMGGSGGGVQDAVRSRLARLKRDLMAAQAKLATVDQGLASIAFTPTSSITASGTPGSRASSLLRRTPPTPGTAAPLGSLIAAAGSSGAAATASAQQELSLGSSSRAAAMIAAGSYSPPLVTAHASPSAVNQASRLEPTSAAAAAAAAPASAPAQGPITTTVTAAAAAAAPSATGVGECTPPATRRSVRFADMTRAAGSERGMLLRMGTPYSHSTAAALPDGSDDAASPASASASPVVASSRRSPLGVAGRRIAAPLRSPPAEAQSAARPAAAVARFALERGDGGWGSSSGSDEDGELLFDASRMAQRANRQATPSPARRPASGAATPMAHPERYGGFAAGCGGAGAATPTTATSMLSTSSFSPPRPLALLAVRPLGRMHRRGALLRGVGAAGGRRRSEADEREFRRRAAALNIQVSPYFRRPRGGQAADGE